MTDKMTPTQVIDLIGENEFFTVEFIKRTNGERRTMNGRMGVKKHLRGGERAYDFDAKGVVGMWDPNAKGKHGPKDEGYRVFPVDGLLELRTAKMVHKFDSGILVESAPKA